MFGVTILGNNSAIPAHDRHPSAQAVTIANQVLLIDCGEGTQMQIKDYKVKRSKINYIFISHLHGDHYFGLIGLLSSMALISRTEPLHLFAPPQLFEVIQLQLKIANSTLPFQLHFHPLEKDGEIVHETKFTVSCFKVMHRIDCFGFLIKEKHKCRKVDLPKVVAAGIPAMFYERLQNGEDYITKEGKCIENEMVTIPGKRNKAYAYCADTLFTESFLPYIQEVDLLYHESTYLNDFVEQAQNRFHSTAEQAAIIAKKAKVKKLIIGHFSSKYKTLDLFETQSQLVFPNTELSKEGVTYLV